MPRELMFETTAKRFMLRDYDLPPLGPGDVQVRIELAAPKHGTESHLWSGNVNRGRRLRSQLVALSQDFARLGRL